MPFEKGKPKTGGRKPGSLNKVNSVVKGMITDLIEGNFQEVANEFKNLPGRDKVRAWIDLLPYVAPKMSSVETVFDWENATDEQLDYIVAKLKGESE